MGLFSTSFFYKTVNNLKIKKNINIQKHHNSGTYPRNKQNGVLTPSLKVTYNITLSFEAFTTKTTVKMFRVQINELKAQKSCSLQMW